MWTKEEREKEKERREFESLSLRNVEKERTRLDLLKEEHDEMKNVTADQEVGLFHQLLSPGIKMISIKGAPGTGKTSLALRLLEFAGSGTYISTRVGMMKLSYQNSRLPVSENVDRLQKVMLDASKTDYKDLRLATPSIALAEILKAVKSKKRLTILDSWDAIAKEMDAKDRLKIEKTIAAIIDTSKSSAVFISEEPELSTVDYMVDAVLALGYVEIEGRQIREITIEKLRGHSINERKKAYTLKDGLFSFLTKPVFETKTPRKFKPVSGSDTHFSTGSEDLDSFLGGGLSKGLLMLLEDGKRVGTLWHLPLIEMMCANFLMNGGSCLAILPPQVSPRMILDDAIQYVGDDIVNSSLRIISYIPTFQHSSIIDVSGKSSEEVYNIRARAVRDMKLRSVKKHTLWILSMDTYESFSSNVGPSVARDIARSASAIRNQGDVVVSLTKPGTSNTQLLSDNCDVHLKLEEVNGSLILYGKRPPTNPYGVTYDYSAGYPKVFLTEII